jgi:hypothetical protein
MFGSGQNPNPSTSTTELKTFFAFLVKWKNLVLLVHPPHPTAASSRFATSVKAIVQFYRQIEEVKCFFLDREECINLFWCAAQKFKFSCINYFVNAQQIQIIFRGISILIHKKFTT